MREEKIVPIGLKGYEISDRMKELMGMQPITENRKTSVVELTKIGPDGNVYGIVRENHEYYIKTTTKKSNLIAEDFTYIGGLQNKKSEAYQSYAKAIKHLNLKFNSLNEAFDKSGNINVFEDDNLMNENATGFKNEGNMAGHAQSTCCEAPIMDGKCSECGTTAVNLKEAKDAKNNPWAICTASVGREDKAKYEKCVLDVKKEKGIDENITESDFEDEDTLTEVEQAIEDMREGADVAVETPDVPVVENHRLSIGRAVNGMDTIIEGVIESDKKKVYTIL